jgi:acyl carrier protein
MNISKTTPEIVIEIIEEKKGSSAVTVESSSRLIDDLHYDSLSTVEIVMNFEDKFGITIPEEDVLKLKTVQDVIDYIEIKVKEKDAICA